MGIELRNRCRGFDVSRPVYLRGRGEGSAVSRKIADRRGEGARRGLFRGNLAIYFFFVSRDAVKSSASERKRHDLRSDVGLSSLYEFYRPFVLLLHSHTHSIGSIEWVKGSMRGTVVSGKTSFSF